MSLKEPRYRTVAELHELLITQDEQLSAALAAHEETKRKLEALTQHYKIMREGISLRECLLDDKQKYINSLEAKLKEQQEQKPVAYSIGNTLHWHEGQGRTNAELYAYPIDVEALLQQACKEENDECCMQVPGKHFNFIEDSEETKNYKKGWNDACDQALSAIRARMK